LAWHAAASGRAACPRRVPPRSGGHGRLEGGRAVEANLGFASDRV